MFRKKQLIIIIFLPVCFSACNKSTYSISVTGNAIPYNKIAKGNNDAAFVNSSIAYNVTNF
jgi:hypothetical protein